VCVSLEIYPAGDELKTLKHVSANLMVILFASEKSKSLCLSMGLAAFFLPEIQLFDWETMRSARVLTF
jgi:hypothetical protein